MSLVRQRFQAGRSPGEQNPMCYSKRHTAVAKCNPKRALAALKLVLLAVSAYVTIGIEVEEAIKSWGVTGAGGRVPGRS